MAKSSNLAPFFYPESVAVVGASRDETRPSGIVLKNLLHSFHGRVYPVNPKHPELLGIPCFPSVTAIDEAVSLSVLITPPDVIPALLEEHAAKGVGHVIIASAGFGETEGGAGLEGKIKEIAGKSGIRIIGPNCLGIYHPAAGLDTFFLPYDRVPRPPEGNISIISQSGSILGTAMILMEEEGLGVAKAVSYGNRADVDESELMDYLGADDETGVIGLCVESIGDGRGFIRAVQGCGKPVVAIKLGQEPAGKRAARSHTGSIAGRYEVFQAAFRRCGIFEAGTLEEFLDLLKVLSMQRPGNGRRVLIVTNAGGIGVMTADLCNKEGLDVPDLPNEPKERLRRLLPPYYSLSNPVDLTGNSTDDQFALVLRTCMGHFDAAILIPFMTVPGVTPNLGDVIIQAVQAFRKPILSLSPFSKDGERLKESFRRHGIPILPAPQRVVRALFHLLKARPVEPLPDRVRNYQEVKSILTDGGKERGKLLSQPYKNRFLDALGFRYPEAVRVRERSGAVSAAQAIGFPLAVKIASPDILHKTDAGGVRLDIRTVRELEEAYEEVIASAKRLVPDARIIGVDIEAMAPAGIEVIIGGIRDPQFGPVVMFGLGGIFVETIRDVAFGIAPVTYPAARELVESIKGYPLLKGVRGMKGMDVDSIIKAVVTVSEVITQCPEIEEIEFNPAIVHPLGHPLGHPSGMTVVDARVILR